MPLTIGLLLLKESRFIESHAVDLPFESEQSCVNEFVSFSISMFDQRVNLCELDVC